MYPQTLYGHIVSTIEIMSGIFLLAVMTGLIFVRFSRPIARVVFSNSIVIAPLNGKPTLMVRIGNENHHSMVEAEFRIMFSRDEPLLEGGDFRYFYILKLHFDRLTVFPAALTLRHTIDETSPLFGATPESLEASRVLFIVSVSESIRSLRPQSKRKRITAGAMSVSANVSSKSTPSRRRTAHRGLRSPSRNRSCGVNFARAPDVASFCGGRDSHYRFSPQPTKGVTQYG